MGGLATTPVPSYVFNTDPGCKKLSNDKGQLFHHLVAKLLYLSKHTRQDIQTAVAFLCTRVKKTQHITKKSLFKRMKGIILNMPDTDKNSAKHRSVLDNEKNKYKKVST